MNQSKIRHELPASVMSSTQQPANIVSVAVGSRFTYSACSAGWPSFANNHPRVFTSPSALVRLWKQPRRSKATWIWNLLVSVPRWTASNKGRRIYLRRSRSTRDARTEQKLTSRLVRTLCATTTTTLMPLKTMTTTTKATTLRKARRHKADALRVIIRLRHPSS